MQNGEIFVAIWLKIEDLPLLVLVFSDRCDIPLASTALVIPMTSESLGHPDIS